MKITRLWATDSTFSSGPSTGEPTKVDPGAGVAAQGFVPGTPVAAAHVNHLLNEITDAVAGRGVRYAELYEDWLTPAAVDTHVIGDTGAWFYDETNTVTVGPIIADPANGRLGAIQFSTTGGSAIEGIVYKYPVFRFGDIKRAVFVVNARSLATDMAWEAGFTNVFDPEPFNAGGDAWSVGNMHGDTTIATARLRVLEGDQTHAPLGTISANTWHTFELRREDDTYLFYLDGNLVEVAQTNAPDPTRICAPFFRMAAPDSGSNRAVQCDLIYVATAIPRANVRSA